MTASRPFGMGKGRIYPASAATHLLNPLRRLVQPPSRVIRRMNLASDCRVLEIGCGPGWFSPLLAATVPHGRLTVCDLQQEMLDLASLRLASFTNVEFARADACSLPFDDSGFDAILVSSVLGELTDPIECLHECARLLSPRGLLTVVETRRDSDFIPRRDLHRMATTVGLESAATYGPAWEHTTNFRRARTR